jgi:hypothetical protein
MANSANQMKPRGPAGALKRPQYEVGHYLSARDLQTEQRYRLQRLRRHNRYLHGWGVICGLWIVPLSDAKRPWAVQVCPGYAIGPYGDEIDVPAPAVVDIRDYLWKVSRGQKQPVHIAYIAIRFVEQQVCPIPASPPGCGCDDTVYELSRLQDDFQVDVLWRLPETNPAERLDLCQQHLAPCPDCPESPYVVLACVTLPVSEGDPITTDHIDNFVRR